MKDNIHDSSFDFEEQSAFFEELKVPYERDKKAVWEELSKKIEKEPNGKIVSFYWSKIAAAAVVLLVMTVSFMRFYETTIDCQGGEHLVYVLPDNSTVHLNAVSTIRYAPYWWRWKRSVSLKGEAFFKVEKGSSFVVSSKLGYTEVLGTSFNIYARGEDYKVYCKTGKVGVHTADSEQSIVLIPRERGLLQEDILRKEQEVRRERAIAWLNNEFYFDNMPLVKVLDELERQYDLKIVYDKTVFEGMVYGGFFSKRERIEPILEIIGANFGFSFVKENNKLYKLVLNM